MGTLVHLTDAVNWSKTAGASVVWPGQPEGIRDEMEALGPVRLTEVQEAQKQIVAVARQMADAGTIVLAGRGGEEMV